MEHLSKFTGKDMVVTFRDEKARFTGCIKPLTADDVILGQYVTGNDHPEFIG